MTPVEFAKGMAFLGACLDRDISTATIEAWFRLLGDLEVKQFERAVVEVVRNHKFSGLPPVGLIRQAAGVSSGVPDADTAAVAAWDKVLRAMREHGAYKSIEWGDAAIPAAIETVAGSWAALCDQTSEQLHKFTSRQFLDAYKALRSLRIAGPSVSPGLIAEDAGRKGFALPEPTSLGEEPRRLYGFGAGETKLLPGPAAEWVPMLPELDLRADDEPTIPETIEEFEDRKAAMIRALQVKYANVEQLAS